MTPGGRQISEAICAAPGPSTLLRAGSAVQRGALPEAYRARFADYLELTKPRLSLLSVLTALVGYLAAVPKHAGPTLLHVLLGTAFCAGGVAALNQWLEVDTDARMRRTRSRPLPAGRVATCSAFVLGWGLCAAGLALLFAKVNGPAAFLALSTVVCYLALYTPAKRWSRWSTEIGAVAGALPPLIGWAAGEGRISALGWVLFGVLFFWQIPHFMAIAWLYRDDYAAVNFPMLPVRDPGGSRVAAWSFSCTATLVTVTLLPVPLGLCGLVYGAAAAGLGGWFLWRAATFLRPANREIAARRLFFSSLAYLPAVLLALVLDRVGLF
ncbi:MAG: protoheme IX farnesyltransferase [Verrucomicrobia bacterium RIFCSPLOWO2_12_FULL_64_8]|nr:MAG: protoheme IX farnesyltransferase [Verrucomicrobia bacterium RIFCSPLOWO2_12_FULL_64_8]